MPKRLPDRTRARAQGLLREHPDIGIDRALATLHAEGHVISRGSVQNIQREVKALPDSVRELDQRWTWSRASERGIAPDAAARILKVEASMFAYEPFPFLIYEHTMFQEMLQSENSENSVQRKPRIVSIPERKSGSPPPPEMTWRRAIWFDRTLPATEGLNDHDRFWLNEQFVSRDRHHDWFGRHIGVADLEALLAFQPWESSEAESVYGQAVAAGNCPSLKFLGDLMHEFGAAEQAYGIALNLGVARWQSSVWPREVRELTMLPDDELSIRSIAVRWNNQTLRRLFETASTTNEGDSNG